MSRKFSHVFQLQQYYYRNQSQVNHVLDGLIQRISNFILQPWCIAFVVMQRQIRWSQLKISQFFAIQRNKKDEIEILNCSLILVSTLILETKFEEKNEILYQCTKGTAIITVKTARAHLLNGSRSAPFNRQLIDALIYLLTSNWAQWPNAWIELLWIKI